MVNMLFSEYNFNESWAKDTVKRYMNSNDKVLIVPFSFGENINCSEDWERAYSKSYGKYYESVVKPFMDYGIKEENIEWVNYFKAEKEDVKSKIKSYNIIFFTGGFPCKMMERLIEFDLVKELESFKGLIIGASAGAMIQIEDYHITPDDDYKEFYYKKGLNLISDFDVEVHYKGSDIQDYYIGKVINEKNKKVYGITNKGGIIFEDGKDTLLGDVKTFIKN